MRWQKSVQFQLIQTAVTLFHSGRRRVCLQKNRDLRDGVEPMAQDHQGENEFMKFSGRPTF